MLTQPNKQVAQKYKSGALECAPLGALGKSALLQTVPLGERDGVIADVATVKANAREPSSMPSIWSGGCRIVACNLILEYTLSVAVCARAATAYGATLLGLQPGSALISLGPLQLDVFAVLLVAALGALLALGTKESAAFNSGALAASRKLSCDARHACSY